MRQLDLFFALQSSTEGIDTEFKSARGGMPGSFWESYSAMANSQGGTIVLGVAEKASGLVWEGVPDAAQLRTVLWGQLNDRHKVSANLLRDDDVRTVEDDEGHQFVVVNVPRASRLQRPVFVGPNPMTGTYRRAEEGDYHCSIDEVRRMLADQSDTPADSQIVEHFGQPDFDPETVKQYRNRFASRAPDHPWLLLDDAPLLTKLSALRRDRATGLEGATVAGLLMFGRFEALRDALPGFHVDYRERLSDDPAVRWTDRVVPDGTWENNLFQFYLRVMQRLSGDLKMLFQLDRELYRKDDSAVHEALREAVVNALVHADHRGQGGVVIERYPDRIELSNPGSLLVSRVQLLQGGVSECRNKSLQLMFQLMGGGDKAGSGMDKIRAGWRSQHWRSPRLEESLQPDRVKLVLPMVSLIPAEVEQALRVRFRDRFAKLDKTAVQAVVTAQVEGSVTNGRMQEITGEHSKDITGVLQSLVRDGLLTQQNQRRWASYRVAEDFPQLQDDSPHLEVDSPQSSPQWAGDSPQLAPNSPQLDRLAGLSPEIQRLLPVAEPARKNKKLPVDQLKGIIQQLCEGRWLATSELAALVDRDADKLQSRFLTAMVREGVLELRYPDVRNRPDQAYRTAVAESH
jgi:ATP-dependent DNA helicase RecG